MVSVYIWLRVGSASESAHEAGMAHFLEHMLFKGAGEHGVGEAVTKVESLGGEINAWTSFESTVLHATVPAGRELPLIRLMADMAFRPHLDAVELDRERKVVIEELRGAEDSPLQILANRQRGRAWGPHPYGSPILGTVDSVGRITREDMDAFHRRHYRPRNSNVVVAGPADEEAIRGVVAQTMQDTAELSPVEARSIPKSIVDPGCFSFDGGFEETSIEIAFRIPDLTHDDIAPLDLLAAVLGGSRNSILSRVLRYEKDCVLASWAELENDRDGGLFCVGVMPRRGRAREAVEQMVRIVGGLGSLSVPDGALRRARAGVLSERIRDRETVDGRASRLAWYQANFGDPEAAEHYESAIRRCRVEDLSRVAETWLNLESAVVGMVAPKEELDQEGLVAAVGQRSAQEPVERPRRAPARRATHHVLSNGLTVRCEPDESAELVGISLMGLGGSLAEGTRMPGLGQAWSACLSRGAGGLGPLEFAAEVEERAGAMQSWTGRNTMGIQLSFPVSELGTAMELLSLLIFEPAFDPVEADRIKRDLLQAQQSVLDDPDQLSWDLTWAGLFPGHPWGRSSVGTPASMSRLTTGRLWAYHRRVLQGSNLVMGVSGAVDPEQINQLAERRLGRLREGRRFPLSPPAERTRFRTRPRRLFSREGAPASLVLGFPCPGCDQEGGVTATVLAALLGGASGGAGRLFDSLREVQGLAYSVGASAELGLGAGAVICSMSTDPERMEQAKKGLWSELDRLRSDGVPSEELNRVKNSLVDGAVLGLQRASARADYLAAAELYGEPGGDYRAMLERPRDVEQEDVERMARSILRRDRSCETVVSPLMGSNSWLD